MCYCIAIIFATHTLFHEDLESSMLLFRMMVLSATPSMSPLPSHMVLTPFRLVAGLTPIAERQASQKLLSLSNSIQT